MTRVKTVPVSFYVIGTPASAPNRIESITASHPPTQLTTPFATDIGVGGETVDKTAPATFWLGAIAGVDIHRQLVMLAASGFKGGRVDVTGVQLRFAEALIARSTSPTIPAERVSIAEALAEFEKASTSSLITIIVEAVDERLSLITRATYAFRLSYVHEFSERAHTRWRVRFTPQYTPIAARDLREPKVLLSRILRQDAWSDDLASALRRGDAERVGDTREADE